MSGHNSQDGLGQVWEPGGVLTRVILSRSWRAVGLKSAQCPSYRPAFGCDVLLLYVAEALLWSLELAFLATTGSGCLIEQFMRFARDKDNIWRDMLEQNPGRPKVRSRRSGQ